MSVRFLLFRHGQTLWHAENRYAGSSDVALTAHGREQAGALADYLLPARPDAVVCSPLQRAVHTAEPAAAALGLRLQRIWDLREVHFGRGEGLTRTEMRRHFPEAVDGFLARPASSPLPGGEAGEHAAMRGVAALQRLREEYDPDACENAAATVAVIAHATLIRLVLCRLLGIDLDRYRTVFPELRNVAATTVELRPQDAALLEFNRPL